MENLTAWTNWVRYIFSSPEAASKPWRALGVHHMTWASQQLTAHVRADQGGWSPDTYDYANRRAENPEEALLRAEAEMIAANVERTRPVLDPLIIKRYGRRPRHNRIRVWRRAA